MRAGLISYEDVGIGWRTPKHLVSRYVSTRDTPCPTLHTTEALYAERMSRIPSVGAGLVSPCTAYGEHTTSL